MATIKHYKQKKLRFAKVMFIEKCRSVHNCYYCGKYVTKEPCFHVYPAFRTRLFKKSYHKNCFEQYLIMLELTE